MEAKEEKSLKPVVDVLTEEVLKRLIELMGLKEKMKKTEPMKEKRPEMHPTMAANLQALDALNGAFFTMFYINKAPEFSADSCTEKIDVVVELQIPNHEDAEIQFPGTLTSCGSGPESKCTLSLDLAGLSSLYQF